ncbi:MAG: amidophosphoribosyltransferase [Candidatus Oxydemutatoraceae bacterium WSBS_2016_MAG_OTU14]
MCGIVAMYGQSQVSEYLLCGLMMVQHRGQDAAGIATCDENGNVYQHKSKGLVRDVFNADYLSKLRGNYGIGHVRYPTAGSHSNSESQPFYVNMPYGIALGHNGNLINSDELVHELYHQSLRHISTGSDSEILLNVLGHELLSSSTLILGADNIFSAVERLHRRCQGAYAAVALIVGYGLVAFRDPLGIRPLVYGQKETKKGMEYMFASESVALAINGFTLVRDLAPGETMCVDRHGKLHSSQYKQGSYRSCIFEYVYFSRPDSVIDQVFVHKARMRMGQALGQKILREWPAQDIDVVIPIPDTSRTAAYEISAELKVPCREGFIKNRYIGRTFIMPGQDLRLQSVRQKLNPLDIEFADKNVLLVDDSIVRGTTSKQIIQMARDAGAKKVYFASASPPVCFPNVYGIDMPSADELVAHNKTVEQVNDIIGSDFLIYQDIADLIKAVKTGNPSLKEFECSVFDGKYAHDISSEYLHQLQMRRKDEVMQKEVNKIDLKPMH